MSLLRLTAQSSAGTRLALRAAMLQVRAAGGINLRAAAVASTIRWATCIVNGAGVSIWTQNVINLIYRWLSFHCSCQLQELGGIARGWIAVTIAGWPAFVPVRTACSVGAAGSMRSETAAISITRYCTASLSIATLSLIWTNNILHFGIIPGF